jgi:hypothetical protein
MTGWSMLDSSAETLDITAGQMPHPRFQTWAYESFADEQVQLVIERFTINAGSMKKSREGMHDAIETIGVLKFAAQQHQWPIPQWQMPADVMRLIDDEVLKHLGWHHRGQGHANDSLRHLAVWAIKAGKIGRKDMHPE